MTAIVESTETRPSRADFQSKPLSLRVYIGTYTNQKSKGIYLSTLDLTTGALTPAKLVAETVSPAFLAIHPSHRFLYAVNEVENFGGKNSGAISAFSIDSNTGKLKFLNQQSSSGRFPCYLVVDNSGRNVLVANYWGGSVAVLPIQTDGRLGKVSSLVQNTDHRVNPRCQKEPHAHSINLDPANRFAIVADLGLDKVLVYPFDPAAGTLTANESPSVSVESGAGPRHVAFHPSGHFAYVITEMFCTVTAFTYNTGFGALKPIHTISTLPKGVKRDPDFSAAEVQVHPSGKFLYGSNRGHDTIVVFAIDAKTGKLTHVDNEPTQGKTPRNFAIDPTGGYLLAENQSTDTIVVFRINSKTGTLKPTGHLLKVPSPACVKLLPIPKQNF